jgi:hypothetical protein
MVVGVRKMGAFGWENAGGRAYTLHVSEKIGWQKVRIYMLGSVGNTGAIGGHEMKFKALLFNVCPIFQSSKHNSSES